MASKELMDKLNSAIARELQVSVQYIWQHVMATGLNAEPVKEVFKKIAITEMKHAEEVAERLNYLGGRPTTKPSPITIGESLKEMIENNKKAEEEAITLYREIIEMADKDKDYTTKRLFEQILAEEEEHHGEFSGLLE
jgi:bacterioferritin